MCSQCGHSQRWSNAHVVEVVPLLKECVVGRPEETVKQNLTAALLQLVNSGYGWQESCHTKNILTLYMYMYD